MGRKKLFDKPLTAAEKMKRYRAKKEEECIADGEKAEARREKEKESTGKPWRKIPGNFKTPRQSDQISAFQLSSFMRKVQKREVLESHVFF